MRRNFAELARRLIATPEGEADTATQVAERAEQACNKLARHLSRLLGETGVEMLLKRSIVQASAGISWLVSAPDAASLSSVRAAMEHQNPEAIVEAFVAVLTAFVALLERLIGEGLVDRLLSDVWTTVFTNEPKDTP